MDHSGVSEDFCLFANGESNLIVDLVLALLQTEVRQGHDGETLLYGKVATQGKVQGNSLNVFRKLHLHDLCFSVRLIIHIGLEILGRYVLLAP